MSIHGFLLLTLSIVLGSLVSCFGLIVCCFIGRKSYEMGAYNYSKWCDLQINILKRLQREAFSDIMKLRDRQDKVERILTYYKSSKGSPFQESSTRVRGNVDALGALFMMDDVDEQKYDAIQRSGIRNGIDARLRFDTDLREKDKLVAEFLASGRGQGDMLGGPLSLAKVVYAAHFSDWFSAVAIPMGAECRDIGFQTSTHQVECLLSLIF